MPVAVEPCGACPGALAAAVTGLIISCDMQRPKSKKMLAAGHGWQAKPNHKVLLLGRGAVRLEYPGTWIVEADDDSVKVYDRDPPDDECVLGVSYHLWPPVSGEGLGVGRLVRSALESDERSFVALDPISEETRIDLSLAWGAGRFVDSRFSREACARLCIARKGEIQALLTFDFWWSDLGRSDARWRDFLASLQLGQWVADPAHGPLLS